MKNKNNNNKRSICIKIIFIIILISIIVVFKSIFLQSDSEEFSYKIITLKKSDPLIFKGISQPKNTNNIYLDSSLGKINNITVKHGQKINVDDVIATYQNITIEELATDKIQSLDKLNLAVTHAQSILDNINNKIYDLQNKIATLQFEKSNWSVDNEATNISLDEINRQLDVLHQELDVQNDAYLPAQQAVDSANADLTAEYNSIEQTKNKIITTVKAPYEGIIYINEKGKSDSSIPYAKIVSPDTNIIGTVTEYDYTAIKKDTKVNINLNNGEKMITGIISFVNDLPNDNSEGPITDVSNNNNISNFSFIVDPDEFIHYGFNVQINIPTDYLELPEKSIIDDHEKKFVFIYKNGKSYKKEIVTSNNMNKKIIIESGLNENDQVIINPNSDLKDNHEVIINR